MTKEMNIITTNEKYVEKVNANAEQNLVNEIVFIKTQTEQLVLMNSIEIGRRLVEAKKLIKHGEWANWLKERVSFSQRTATNLMKIYEEYGKNGLATNSETIAQLNYTQALALLAVPTDSREDFAKENDVAKKTIKELKETIEKVQADKDSSDKELASIKVEYEKLKKENADKDSDIKSLSNRIENLRAEQKKAAESMDAELEKRLADSIKDTENKMSALENEKTILEKKIQEAESAHKEALRAANNKSNEDLKKVQAAADEKLNKEIEKKNQEIARATKKFSDQLDKTKQQLNEQREKTKNAEREAKVLQDLAKCEALLSVIESNYEEITIILKRFRRTYPEHCAEIEKTIADVLKAMEKRANIKAVS